MRLPEASSTFTKGKGLVFSFWSPSVDVDVVVAVDGDDGCEEGCDDWGWVAPIDELVGGFCLDYADVIMDIDMAEAKIFIFLLLASYVYKKDKTQVFFMVISIHVQITLRFDRWSPNTNNQPIYGRTHFNVAIN